MAKVPNGIEILPHERYRQTTDDRQTDGRRHTTGELQCIVTVVNCRSSDSYRRLDDAYTFISRIHLHEPFPLTCIFYSAGFLSLSYTSL